MFGRGVSIPAFRAQPFRAQPFLAVVSRASPLLADIDAPAELALAIALKGMVKRETVEQRGRYAVVEDIREWFTGICPLPLHEMDSY